MANKSVSIPPNTIVDLTAAAALVPTNSYTIQAQGSDIYLDEQAAPPSDQATSLFIVSNSLQGITQGGTDNFYVFAKQGCKIVIAEVA